MHDQGQNNRAIRNSESGGVPRAPIFMARSRRQCSAPRPPLASTLTALAPPRGGRLGITLALCTILFWIEIAMFRPANRANLKNPNFELDY